MARNPADGMFIYRQEAEKESKQEIGCLLPLMLLPARLCIKLRTKCSGTWAYEGYFSSKSPYCLKKCKRTKRGLKLDRHGDYHMKTHRGKMITSRRGLRLELLLHAKECLGSSRRLKWKWRLLSQKQLKGKAPPAFFTSTVGRQHISAFLGHPVYGAYGSI